MGEKKIMELLTNTALVNSCCIYQYITGKQISITSFRESLVVSLINPKYVDNIITEHTIEEIEKRGRCSFCYKTFADEFAQK